jgi:hypothetical protein
MQANRTLSTSHQPTSLNELSGMAKLFAIMAAMYGKLWFDQWADTPPSIMEEVWRAELQGFSKSEIEAGVAACRKLNWPPTLPQFVKLCRPDIDAEFAWKIAGEGMRARENGEMGNWPDPCIYWAASRFGPFEVLNEPLAKHRVSWIAELDRARNQQAKGLLPEIPQPRKALVAPGKAITPREEARKRIRELRDKLRGSSPMVDSALRGIGNQVQ